MDPMTDMAIRRVGACAPSAVGAESWRARVHAYASLPRSIACIYDCSPMSQLPFFPSNFRSNVCMTLKTLFFLQIYKISSQWCKRKIKYIYMKLLVQYDIYMQLHFAHKASIQYRFISRSETEREGGRDTQERTTRRRPTCMRVRAGMTHAHTHTHAASVLLIDSTRVRVATTSPARPGQPVSEWPWRALFVLHYLCCC